MEGRTCLCVPERASFPGRNFCALSSTSHYVLSDPWGTHEGLLPSNGAHRFITTPVGKNGPSRKGGGCSRETAHSFGETSVLHRFPAGKLLTFIFHTHTNDKNSVSIPYNLCPQCRGNFCTLCECLCIGGEKHNRGGSSGPPVFEYMVPLWARNPGATPAHLGHPVHPPHQGCPNLE